MRRKNPWRHIDETGPEQRQQPLGRQVCGQSSGVRPASESHDAIVCGRAPCLGSRQQQRERLLAVPVERACQAAPAREDRSTLSARGSSG